MIRFLAALAALLAVSSFGQGQDQSGAHEVPRGTPTFPTIGRVLCEFPGCTASYQCRGDDEPHEFDSLPVDIGIEHPLSRAVSSESPQVCFLNTTGFVDVQFFVGFKSRDDDLGDMLLGMTNRQQQEDAKQCDGSPMGLRLSCPENYNPNDAVPLDVSIQGSAREPSGGYRYLWAASQGSFDDANQRSPTWTAPRDGDVSTVVRVRVWARVGNSICYDEIAYRMGLRP